MRQHLLLTHILISATLILAACGKESSQTAAKDSKATTDTGAIGTHAEILTEAAHAYGIAPSRPNLGIVPAPQESLALPPKNTENYDHTDDNPIKRVAKSPISTFAIDVDTGSYANLRRFLMNGQKPPADAMRVEEMLNYLTYDYKGPRDAGRS